MSRTAKLYPTRIYRTDGSLVIENESNMYTSVDSDTYATVTNSTSNRRDLYLGGFDFSLVPSNAIISSFSIKLRLGRESVSSASNGNRWIFNGTNVVTVANKSTIYVDSGARGRISVIDPTPLSFENLRAYGDDFNLGVFTLTNNTTRVYGVEIDVEYELPKNKVVYFGQTLIDLTADTVTAERLTKGFTAHDASGALITGVATEGSTYQDEDDCVVLGEDESSAPQGNLSITANGTYDVAQYAGASVEVPVGMTKPELKKFLQRDVTFKDIDWPDGMTSIGAYAFSRCTNFKPSSLPEGITSIGDYAFYGTALALTKLPDGIVSIGEYAFNSCSNLSLTSLPSGIKRIPASAFAYCTSLALTELPAGVTYIYANAFVSCHSLALTELPAGVTYIGGNAFPFCNGLTHISCDGPITTLGSNAFTGNASYPMQLVTASFPNMALTSSLAGAFGSTTAANACQLLEFCDIGSTTGIGSNAFANCYALETLVLRKTASVCTLGSVSAFLNTPMRGYNDLTGKVYVPSALIESYKTANNWKTLYDAGTVEFVAIEGSEYER